MTDETLPEPDGLLATYGSEYEQPYITSQDAWDIDSLRQAVKRARREALEEAIHIARNRIALLRGREIPEDLEKLLEDEQ